MQFSSEFLCVSVFKTHDSTRLVLIFTGNLTKHMKSKAHMKKCLELGVSLTMDDTDVQEPGKIPRKKNLVLTGDRVQSNSGVFYSG